LESSDAAVAADACRACCNSFSPTPDDPNPVLASLLYAAADRLLAQVAQVKHAGGGLTERRQPLRPLQELRDWAEANLPLVLPEEDDAGPVEAEAAEDPKCVTVDQIARLLPLPADRSAGRPRRWAVGVTTAPRRSPTLAACLESLIAAGWTRPHLFVDGEMELPARFAELPRTQRRPALGAWASYRESLRGLLVQQPPADAMMIVQDDVLFPRYPAVRQYVEQVLWPGTRPSLVSLYCCADYDAPQAGWSPWQDTWHFGALAFVFPRTLADAFLSAAEAPGDRKDAVDQPVGGIDVRVGEWARRQGIEIYRPTPSLVQHIGHVSTLWPTSRAVGLRRASRYVGQLLAGSVGRTPLEFGDAD
jgi:hypothetical protein